MSKEHEPTCWRVMGYSSQEEFLRKARARTMVMSKILKIQARQQRPTEEMLNRVIDL